MPTAKPRAAGPSAARSSDASSATASPAATSPRVDGDHVTADDAAAHEGGGREHADDRDRPGAERSAPALAGASTRVRRRTHREQRAGQELVEPRVGRVVRAERIVLRPVELARERADEQRAEHAR